MSRVKTVSQEYAHFHRVLSELLLELAELPDCVIWLTDERHQIKGDHQQNVYAKALYRIPSLEPYQDRLEELGRVQRDAVQSANLPRIPNNLFLPKVIEGVTHVRVNDQITYSSTVKKKAFVIEHIAGVLAQTRANYHRFELHGGPHDAGSRRIEDEIKRYERTLKRLRALPVDDYRVRKEIKRLRPYLYRVGQKPVEIEIRRHGVLLVGENIKLGERVVREGRSDRVRLEPLFHSGGTFIYLEKDWKAARERVRGSTEAADPGPTAP